MFSSFSARTLSGSARRARFPDLECASSNEENAIPHSGLASPMGIADSSSGLSSPIRKTDGAARDPARKWFAAKRWRGSHVRDQEKRFPCPHFAFPDGKKRFPCP